MVRVGLIGNGKWGKNYIKAVNGSGFGEVVQIFNTDSLCRKPSTTLSNNCYRSDDAVPSMLVESSAFSSLDAFIVATHPPLTELYTIELLKMGKSVMAEKPLTFNPEALDQIEQILDKQIPRPTFLINHQHLFSHSIDFIKATLDRHSINAFVSEAGNFGPHRKYSPLWDYGPHDFAILAYLGGTDLKLINHQISADGNGRDEVALIEFNSTSVARVRTWNNHTPKTHRVALEFLNHQIIYDDFDINGKVKIDDCYVTINDEPPLERSVKAFLSNVGSKKSETDYRFGIDIARGYTNQLCLTGNPDFYRGYR
jgi:predicted dehydrogenase